MYSLTQGTIITGVRSDKYSNIRCNGVVISARCDLANCKISKIYYLIAVPSDDWLLSDEGFNIVLSQRQNDLEDKLQTKLGGSGLDWSTLKSFSVEEFSTVIHDQEVGLKKDTDKVLEVFRTFKNYTSKYLELGDKKAILQNESKSVASSLLKIANGQMMHYIYVPENAYIKDGSIDRGLIIDLQELEYISIRDAERLVNCEIDIQSKDLSEVDKQRYNNCFFLMDWPGYAMAEYDIASPWTEYIMQRFSNAFIRIGVDGPQKEDVQSMVSRVSKQETSSLSRSIKTDDPIILSDPYNVNGLEFKCVILFGVDEGRLPQNTGVSDISANYIKYIAFNQLYLASSRAKYRLILIGNSLHGVSSCLQYALESGKLETGDQV